MSRERKFRVSKNLDISMCCLRFLHAQFNTGNSKTLYIAKNTGKEDLYENDILIKSLVHFFLLYSL